MYPFFHQDWKLFVPPPQNNYRLFLLEKNNSKDIFQDLVIRHRSNRLGGHGHQLTSMANLIHYFEKNAAGQSALNGPVQNNLYFDMLLQAVKAYQFRETGQNTEPKIILLVTDALTGKSRTYFN